MGKVRGLAGLVVVCGCGRFGFDATQAAGDGAVGDGAMGVDALPARSCELLPATCGPAGGSCCESLLVPAGMFFRSHDVGSDGAFPDTSFPATVGAFRLDRYEVTVGRFRQFVEAGRGTQVAPPDPGAGAHPRLEGSGWDPSWNPALAADTAALQAVLACDASYQTWTVAPAGNEGRPMNCLSWYEAMAFCAWDGGFLPTEAEWNYAAAGGDLQRAFPWSEPPSSLMLDDTTHASYYVDATLECYGDMAMGCAVTDLILVGTKPDGNARWGHADLAGNAWEWAYDWFTAYPVPCDDCANPPGGTERVRRGGGFGDLADNLRGAGRFGRAPAERGFGTGVRCARP